jgi:hypothetical protein
MQMRKTDAFRIGCRVKKSCAAIEGQLVVKTTWVGFYTLWYGTLILSSL